VERIAFGSEGGDVVVEVDALDPRRFERVARGDGGLVRVAETFEGSLAGIKRVAAAVAKTLDDVRPDEAEVELGFKISAESGVILAKAGGEAHIVVKLTWKRASSGG
jgi:hypothetical protein